MSGGGCVAAERVRRVRPRASGVGWVGERAFGRAARVSGRRQAAIRPRSLEADRLGAADDHVIEQFDIQQVGRLRQLPGERHVLRAGRRIGAGMVVADDDLRYRLHHGRPQDLRRPDLA